MKRTAERGTARDGAGRPRNGKGDSRVADAMNFLREQAGEKPRPPVRPGTAVPDRHNHYNDAAFFRPERERGIIRNAYGQRVVRVSEDFITGLLAGLEQEVGEAAGEVLYKAGFQWGVEDMKNFLPRVGAEFDTEFSKMAVGMLLETWWWPIQVEGWGSWRYDFRQGRQGLIFVDLYESAVAQSLGDVGKVVCYLYAGLFAAAFTVLARRELGCIEIQCYSMGEDHCKFLVANSERVNAAAFWRNEGATSKDILKKIAEGAVPSGPAARKGD